MKSVTLTLTNRKNDFTTFHQPPIKLNDNEKYEAALLSMETYNSFPNITSDNNLFKYSADNGQTWKIIKLNTGSYDSS